MIDCCVPGDECDDNDACTDDYCIGYSCKHVKKHPGCCTTSAQCDDNNVCTIDQCNMETMLCEQGLDLAGGCCCMSPSDCNDFIVCTEDKCVNHMCKNTEIENCCWSDDLSPFAPMCDDNNICTCDMCIFGQCRNLPPGWAPPMCGLSPLCCTATDDCEPPTDPCEFVTCDLGTYLCEYSPVEKCAVPLPIVHTFNFCPDMEEYGWAYSDLQGEGEWACGYDGPLGSDGHLQFVGGGGGPVESMALTPRIESNPCPAVTIQYDRALDLQGGEAHLLLYVVEDTNSNDVVDAGDLFTPIRDESFVVDLAGDTVAHVVSGQDLAQASVGFGVAAADAADVVRFDLDNVRVCPGEAPVWDELPEQLEASPGKGGEFPLAAHDPDGDDLYFILKSAPSFLKLGEVVCDDWGCTSTLEVWPDAGDVGEYTIRLRIGDGCLWWEATVLLTVD